MPGLTPGEARVLAAVDEAELLRMLVELVQVPSVTGSAAESELQHRLARQLAELGLEVDLWSMDLAELRSMADFPGMEADRVEGWGLVAWTEDGEEDQPPALILQGHVDVVPPGDLRRWTTDPFRAHVSGQALQARGACDMKAGVAAMLGAVKALRRAGVRLRRRLALHLVVGEEDGGLGAFATLCRGHRGQACLIPEPTSETLITAAAGALTFRLRVSGRATHGSSSYAGASAVDAYLPLHLALSSLEARRNRDVDPLMREYPVAYTISVGRLQAGDWASSVPDLLLAEGRLGVALDENPAHARRELELTLREACRADPWLRTHPVEVEWWGGQFESGRLPPGHWLEGLVAKAVQDLYGAPPRTRGAPYGSDLRLYAAQGIATLHLGPGDVRLAHGPNEEVPLLEMVRVCRALTLTVLRCCA